MTVRRVLVVGAGSALGQQIVHFLRHAGINVLATYRTTKNDVERTVKASGVRIAQLDLTDLKRAEELSREVDAVIALPILSVSAPLAKVVPPGVRLLFFSSNNVGIDTQSAVYDELRSAEKSVLGARDDALVLRPTMIYGYQEDGNLSQVMRLMMRFRVAPLAGSGKALTQPIYYKDLAQIAVQSVLSAKPRSNILSVAGPDAVSQHNLYHEIRETSRSNALVMPVPVTFLKIFRLLSERVGIRFPLSKEQLARAETDRLPVVSPVVLGTTSLAEGLSALRRALDETPAGT